MRRVLLVDDQPPVLEALRRQLTTIATVETAGSGPEGLAIIERSEPFAVIVSDMGMPGMDGAQFLEQARKLSPDSVRMILTGQAELESTIAAVNLGRVFRFLTKPCRSPDLIAAVEAGLEQYGLITARRELLERTLHGTVQALTEILAVTNPVAQQRATRIARYARDLCEALGVPMDWQLRIALMLSQIGCIALPEEVLARLQAGQPLPEEFESIYRSHPALAEKLLGGIPRLEIVGRIIALQMEPVDASDLPADLREWPDTAFGALILRICTDFDDAVIASLPRDEILAKLRAVVRGLPPAVEQAVGTLKRAGAGIETTLVNVSQLQIGMVLDEDVVSLNGLRLVPKGQEVTRSILLRLQSFAEGVGVVQPFRVSSA